MLDNYITFLEFLNKELEKFFEEQKPYIFCKRGCAKCCQNAQFPYSKLEASYLKIGYIKLDTAVREIVTQNITEVKRNKANYSGKKFLYTCPFLINNECCVYEYRGIVCRTFGLIAGSCEESVKIPFCYKMGLNYANVMDFERNKITDEKWKNSGIVVEPHGYKSIDYDNLTSKKYENVFKLEFGEKLPLIDWF